MKDGFDKAKDLAQVFAVVAVPVVIATFGWIIQSDISEREVRRDYVQMAISVLSDTSADAKVKQWAAQMLTAQAPISATQEITNLLASNGLGRPTLPSNLSAPCPPVPSVDTESWDDLNRAHIDLAFQYGACAAMHDALVRAWGS